ncbi:hypothetical protein HMPREF9444_00318 [Succinatimonas hippei YIT 12066]|uniref:Uncharacterized protein n=1 Tax=Succinatimonas hippei (strain DSM 22608 / JCM 16073 / KCTC 15190 / YIT 12066) TaxID=762983 RepID=E8LI03_SUCHY|nr:hypothetical protein HMPREF9444_00318 [Succinatimonas hippei YIT 12066]
MNKLIALKENAIIKLDTTKITANNSSKVLRSQFLKSEDKNKLEKNETTPTAVTVCPAVPLEISKSSAISDNKLTGINSEAIRQVTPKHKVISTGLNAFCGELLIIVCIF